MHSLILTLAAGLAFAGSVVSAHEVTYRGTVVKLDEAAVTVKVVNEDAGTVIELTFNIDDETTIFRGDREVTLARADIRVDEPIAVTINDDYEDMFAVTIRLEAEQVTPESPPSGSPSRH